MTLRLSVSREIQLAEVLIGLGLMVPWVLILLLWPEDDVAMSLAVSVGCGVTGADVVRHVVEVALPDRPQTFRRPMKAVFIALLAAVVTFLIAAAIDPYLNGPSVEGVTPRHQLLPFVLGFGAAGFAFTLWPPDPIAPPGMLGRRPRLRELPGLFGR